MINYSTCLHCGDVLDKAGVCSCETLFVEERKCPECGELLLKKNTKNGIFEVCSSRTCSYKKKMTTEENSDGATE